MDFVKIKDLIKNAPKTSGVYQFLDKEGAVLYVGKAKNLQKRLLNYSAQNRLSARISRMVFLAEKIDITSTATDLEAILLEHNLIKKLSPKFNILLRDDKSFAMIGIDKKHQFGRIFKHRGLKDNNSFYFGPFASAGDVNRVIDVLKKSFLLRSCSDSEFKSRKKPCLEYQIKRCSAPCVSLILREDYHKSISDAVDFLSGKSSQIQEKLAGKMQMLSEQQNYEKAALIRDRIKSLSSIQAKQNVNLSTIVDSDVITIVNDNGQYLVYVSFYRGGNNYGSKPYFYGVDETSSEESIAEFLEKFLGQFYLNQTPPPNILLNCELAEKELMEKFLSNLAEKKVEIQIPKYGDKFRLVADQELIAKNVLQQKIEQNLSDKKILFELKELFQLSTIIDRIEVYDNSHTANENAVGAMIVAGKDGFVKSAYRKFNIKHMSTIIDNNNRDDTAMLQEVLLRRFKNYSEESVKNSDDNARTEKTLPDLIIIDGGLPQLSAATKVLEKLRINIPLICMAKGENRNAGEETYHQQNKPAIKLQKNSALAFYLQRLRDEAHRFAITTHRAKRAKSITKSKLDDVPNIGGKRKKALLNYFGSIEKIKEASVQDLQRVNGISQAIAKKIWEFFR